MNANLIVLRDKLVREGKKSLKETQSSEQFTKNPEANKLINDLKRYPHAFVFACIVDRQIPAEKAWEIPFHLKNRLGFFDFPSLATLKHSKFEKIMTKPTPLHRFPTDMARYLYLAKERMKSEYSGRANRIWRDNPSSAQVIRRFLEFDGVGPKISTMAANILARKFKIPMSDHYSIDISVDVQIKRVFWRLGFVPKDASPEYIIYRARELNPSYPGIFDYALWDIGRTVCRPKNPHCNDCKYISWCLYANQSGTH